MLISQARNDARRRFDVAAQGHRRCVSAARQAYDNHNYGCMLAYVVEAERAMNEMQREFHTMERMARLLPDDMVMDDDLY